MVLPIYTNTGDIGMSKEQWEEVGIVLLGVVPVIMYMVWCAAVENHWWGL